ncbi:MULTISPECIES: plasmid replication protein RepC [Agrobacterium]|uniref:NAD-dependent succinate-semialdehyde dehydrogenase n=1 Tax=Agrobacterium larrymoorei TaxID=160699 RepID=A0A2Z2Q3P0_9HYPH|nr:MULTISPECIES: plasmid replication protein RepC [Agrobacterium]ASK49498.1 NAD-dependent succinate-semialdehyde dehydrogenase [Agrobacterium larrymoorei]NTB05666.1 replication initiation protein RepC [Agrobacterium tumefaciens]NTD89566.1 replication initiation protein RepC [Agrobacterium tumefaciens]NTD93063.1 replication initiation protein RepC [Agrobacterium tumefaciens]NTE01671.1 replication initiation protein RepC [Agrobacterium tumefaciens]
METRHVTTPFGRRPMTLALVKRQVATNEIKAGKTVEKWKVFRDASEAREELGLQSNSLAVLDALLSFYPENELRQDAQLVVFPSNAQLILRAHGMAGATLRRHLALLVDAGLIVRKDSANGKRYARKNGAGEIESAFGFDLSPILARSEELAVIAQKVVAARSAFRKAKENLTICRRDVRKLITAAIEEGADGDWFAIEAMYIDLVSRIPRHPTTADIANILDELELLREEIVNLLDLQSNSKFNSTNDAQIEQHLQNSKSESFHELEPSSEKEQGEKPNKRRGSQTETLKAFPLGVVLKACPQIIDYGPAGTVGGWRDLMSAAVVVRSMLGVSPSAYQEACETMGPENTAVAVACILERAGHIKSAGGYLRDLTNRAARGQFSLGPMVMALLRLSGEAGKQSA